MNHYDLYASLGLSRRKTSFELAAEIDDRMRSGVHGSKTQASELGLARSVLGNPRLKDIYDRQLDDPTAPPITLVAIQQLSQLPANETAPATPASRDSYDSSPAPGTTTRTPRSRRRSPVPAPVLSGVIVLAVAAVAIAWMITSSRTADVDSTADGAGPAFSSETDSTELTPSSGTSAANSKESDPAPTLSEPDGPGILSVEAAIHDKDSAVCGDEACDRIVLTLNGQSELQVREGSGGNGMLQFIISGDNLQDTESVPIENKAQGHIEGITFQGGSSNTTIMNIYTDGFSTATSTTELSSPDRSVIDIIR